MLVFNETRDWANVSELLSCILDLLVARALGQSIGMCLQCSALICSSNWLNLGEWDDTVKDGLLSSWDAFRSMPRDSYRSFLGRVMAAVHRLV